MSNLDHLIVKGFKNHWRENQSAEEYHADKTAVNNSSLKNILKSPKSFLHSFTEKPKEPTPALRLGSLFHLSLLEHDKFKRQTVVAPDFGDLRKKENKEFKLQFQDENEGKELLSQEDMDKILYMTESVIKHKDAMILLKDVKREISGYFKDPETNIIQKFKPDAVSFNINAEIDVKTTKDCSLESFQKSIWNYRYDFQRAMYREGIKAITGKYPDYSAFIAVENEAPYECAVYFCDDALIEKASMDYRFSLNKLKECIDNNDFGSYQKQATNISLPYWAFRGEE